jgi:hypothetical protein
VHEVKVEDLTVHFHFTWSSGPSLRQAAADGSLGKSGGGVYEIRPKQPGFPGSLMLISKLVTFDATVYSGGPLEVRREWQVGLLQSIVESTRTASYDNGVTRRFRLDTSSGPLSDCFTEHAPFFGEDGPESLVQYPARVDAQDDPSFWMPLEFKGSHAEAQPLVSTSGQDRFCTFLVIARERDKSVVVLTRLDWAVSWNGTFKKGEWGLPDEWAAAGEMFTAAEVSRPEDFTNLRGQPRLTPFSLRMVNAEAFARIDGGAGWTPCDYRGNTANAAPTNLSTWVNAAAKHTQAGV